MGDTEEIIRSILNGPEYFYCEKARCKLKISSCIERQLINERAGAFQLAPFPICEDCPAGFENRRRPLREKAMSNDAGLPDVAATAVPGATGGTSEVSPVMCKDCGVRETISPKHSLCASCMNKRSKAARQKDASQRTKARSTKAEGGPAITIDFSSHPDVYKDLESLSVEEVRPIDMQVIYLLKQTLQASCKA